jgi:flagellin
MVLDNRPITRVAPKAIPAAGLGMDARYFQGGRAMASFSVVSNITSAYAQANLQSTQAGLQSALSRLSSGFRINQSGDDAAGLAMANGFRNDSVVLSQGIRNANDALSDLQIKDGALSNISTLLDRLSTLATQAASATDGLSQLNDEFAKVLTEIDREAAVAGLNDAGGFSVFVSNNGTNGQLSGTFDSAKASDLNISSLTIAEATDAIDAVTSLKEAVASLGGIQSSIGSAENNLQFAITLAQSQLVNTKAAESRIRDANVAEEAANMTRYNILTQSGIAALTQANLSSSSVLALLK